MRHIEGYVLVGVNKNSFGESFIFYGRAKKSQYLERGFEAFTTGGMAPLESLEKAREVLGNLKKEFDIFDSFRLGQIEMEVAETNKEILESELFLNAHSLIVIWTNDGGDQLW